MKLRQRWLAAWSAWRSVEAPAEEGEEVLSLRSEAAGLRLDLEETRGLLAKEQARRDALERGQATAVLDSVDARLERLFTDLAAPLSQLRTQAHLLDAGKDVAATDVMVVAQQLTRAVEEAGLTPFGEPGEAAAFDSETMQPLRGDQTLSAGERVTVKFVGYRFAGKVVRKALVT